MLVLKRNLFAIFSCLAFSFSTQFVTTATISDVVTILSMYVKNPCAIGEVAPISSATGSELVKTIRKNSNINGVPKKYLEAGGGTGVVSDSIVKELRPCDCLDIIEIDPELCEILKKRMKKYKNVSVHCCSILDWDGHEYDAIISTLPFLSLGVDFAKDTMSYFRSVSKPNTILSCVEYPIAVKFRRVVYGLGLKKAEFTAVQRYMKQERSRNMVGSKTVYFNVPPINVYHLRVG